MIRSVLKSVITRSITDVDLIDKHHNILLTAILFNISSDIFLVLAACLSKNYTHQTTERISILEHLLFFTMCR